MSRLFGPARRVCRVGRLPAPDLRETQKMMLDHYQQTKNLLVSFSPKRLGFF